MATPALTDAELLAKGRTHSVASFSEGLAPLPPHVGTPLLHAWLSPVSPLLARQAMAMDGAKVSQLLFVSGTSLQVLTSPKLYVDSTANPPTNWLVGSLGDRLDILSPAKIPLGAALEFSCSLATTQAVADYDLVSLDLPPDEVPSGTTPAVPASMERLDFDLIVDGDNGTIPKFVAFPKVFLLPCGSVLPPTLSLVATPDPVLAAIPGLSPWVSAMHYLVSQNNGHALHMGGSKFATTDFQAVDILANFDGVSFGASEVRLPVEMLLPGSPLFALASQEVQLLRDQVCRRLGHLVVLAGPPIAAGTAPVVHGNNAALVAALQQVAAVPKSQKQLERDQLSETVKTKYQLLLAQCGPGGTALTPGLLAVPFTNLLDKTGNAGAVMDMKQLFRGVIQRTGRSADRYDGMVALDALVANQALTNCVRLFDWLQEPIGLNRILPKSLFSLVVLLPPTVSGGAFTAFQIEEDQLSKLQLDMSKKEASATVASALYLSGRLESVADVVTTLCSFRALLSSFCTDFDHSVLWETLKPVVELLDSTDGRRWAQVMARTPSVPVGILNLVQVALGRLVAQCHEDTYVEAIKAGNAVSSALFNDYKAVLGELLSSLRTAIALQTPHKFDLMPPGMGTLLGKMTPTHSPPRPSTEPHSKKVKTSSSPTSSTAAAVRKQENTKKGILEYYGPSRTLPPILNVLHKKTGSSRPERLCGHFMIQGWACTLDKCPRPHISRLDALPEKVQKDLVAEVNKSDCLKFAPGKGPAGKSS